MTRPAAASAARCLAAAAALCLAACAGGALPPSGPRPAPPQPPARGYLATTPKGVELEYDATRQTYAVRGRPDTWWLDGRFFRRAADAWESSPGLEGPWAPCAAGDLPAGLAAATLAK